MTLDQEIERRHDANSSAVFEPITRRTWRPSSAEQLPKILQRAFAEMLTGRPGPVVDLPMDGHCDSADVGSELPFPPACRTSGPALPDPASIQASGKLLEGAKRPVIAAGGGVIAAEAWDEL